jgi:hypothetical protein
LPGGRDDAPTVSRRLLLLEINKAAVNKANLQISSQWLRISRRTKAHGDKEH